MEMPSLRAYLLLTVVAAALNACGGEAVGSRAETPASAPEPRQPLTELDALQRDFEVSEARLSAQLQRRQAEPPALPQRKDRAATPADVAPSPKSAPEPRDKDVPAPEAADDAPAPGSVGSACDLVCRALASMRRSADGICSLTSEQHERCTGARGRVELASRQVAAAGCQCRP